MFLEAIQKIKVARFMDHGVDVYGGLATLCKFHDDWTVPGRPQTSTRRVGRHS